MSEVSFLKDNHLLFKVKKELKCILPENSSNHVKCTEVFKNDRAVFKF